MPSYVIHFWRKTPFLRLLLFLIPGILLQWYLQLSVAIWLATAGSALIIFSGFYFLSLFQRFKFLFITGLAVAMLFVALGALLVWKQDVRNNSNWFGHSYNSSDALIVSLDEPLVEKTKSFKANAIVHSIIKDGNSIPVAGRIIVYFKKDTVVNELAYGSQLIFKKPLQEIKNSGNPGGFDYKRYSLFQGITHQVYLQQGEFEIIAGKKEKWLPKFIYDSREWVLTILRNNIKGDKELGLAEALLIGYKDDLDKSLVQSYTNTGVVHVIAISGLHLGIIYLLLVALLRPLKSKKYLRILKPLIIIAGLWLFSLLAGAQPSVLRSAVMFTCIVLGESLGRRTSIYNTLAASAFLLLCYDPYWLWDLGFQLSYSAVLSIVIFMKPVYNLLYFKNKLADNIWKLNAVTLAAQLLTLPISIYHFHQFPSYFFLTNFFAVPLSSVILIGEVILCVFSFVPVLAIFIGKILRWLIWLMNTYVERVEAIPFSLLDGWQINIVQVILLFVFITCISYWLI
ncbi:MAG TPA: ComEC/Rec2 family competence protein, partial [Chitinophagaceae bacterium]